LLKAILNIGVFMQLAESIPNKNGHLTEEYFTDIYLKYSNKIYNLAYRMTYNEEAAEDITQETFIKVLDNYDKFRGDSNIFTWIYTIAKNSCLQYLKKNKKGEFQSIEGLIHKVSVPVDKDQYNDLEKQSYINQVKNGCLLGLLRCLPFYQRIAFILNVLNEIAVKDISLIINKSENSTRILISRARKSLKIFLCSNCSLYQEDNKCKCENLISFSLKQGWIKTHNPAIVPEIIESELKAFKSVILLFKTIPDYHENDNIKNIISNIIKKNTFNIFSDKKVK
jgi:RNA polymerase sigma factor (sigma-70 family)